MKPPRLLALTLSLLVPFLVASGPGTPLMSSGGSFMAFDVMVNSSAPLAAYQVDIQAPDGVKIVGVEGGESVAFNAAPVYDPEAMEHERVILAAFSLNQPASLPSGTTRVARIHAFGHQTSQLPKIILTASADAAGKKLTATATIAQSEEIK